MQANGFTDTTLFGPGPPEVLPRALVRIDQFDQCTGTALLSADNLNDLTVAEDAFQAVKLDSATLNATIEVFDFVSFTLFPVHVSVNWTGIGATTREKIHSQTSTPGTLFIFRGDFMMREATASGTVSDGTTNFTPQPATSAQLFSTKQGDVTITHD